MNRKALSAAVALLVLALVPAALASGPRHYPRGQAQGFQTTAMFRLQLGLFTPEGDSEFWKDTEAVFTGDAEDLEDSSWYGDFEWSVGKHASVMLSGGHVSGSTRQAYIDFVDGDGFDIEHVTRLRITPLTVGLKLYPVGRDNGLNPYAGAGVGFFWWRYSEVGDFIDFDGDMDIIFDSFESDGIATGYYLVAGLDFRVSPTLSLFAEGRWTRADDELDEQFDGFGTIDLSGTDLSLGLAWRF